MDMKLIQGGGGLALCPKSGGDLLRHIRALRAHGTLLLELARDGLDPQQDEAARAFYCREIGDAASDLRERLDALARMVESAAPCDGAL